MKLAKSKVSNKWVAMKYMSKSEIVKMKQVDHVINENTLLYNVQHPLICSMDGFTQDDKYLVLILEFVQGGELFTYLRSIGRFEAAHAGLYGAMVALMFEHLHTKNIIYRDLKPENLLIADDGFLKLTDFGFAKVVEGRTYTLCGTPEYLAPEILLNKGHGKAVDWWCLGILIYEMNAGIDPFTDEDPMGIYQKILKGKIRYPKSFDESARSIVRHLVVADLSKRYGNLKNGVNDIKTHRYFKSINWQAILSKSVPVPYKPKVKAPNDTSNFQKIQDSNRKVPALKPSEDPFLDW